MSYLPCVVVIRFESSLLNLLHLEVKTEAGLYNTSMTEYRPLWQLMKFWHVGGPPLLSFHSSPVTLHSCGVCICVCPVPFQQNLIAQAL